MDEIEELDEEIEPEQELNNTIFEYISANSRQDLFNKLEYYWENKDKRHLTKHSTYEICCNEEIINKLDNEKDFLNNQISLFEAIKKNYDGERCCICKSKSSKLFYWMYEFYFWEDPKDYMMMKKMYGIHIRI